MKTNPFNMIKKNKILISALALILGWLLSACAWTIKLVQPMNTICFIIGLGLFFIGLISLIGSLTQRK